MAKQSRYPVAVPPAAPEGEKTGHLLLRAYAVLVLFSAFAHTFWFNLLGVQGAAVLLGLLTAATCALWVPRLRSSSRRAHGREPFAWRRLPWLAVAYVLMAALSLLWSAWPASTALTAALLASATLQGLFLADVLTWDELVRALESALRWVVGASLAIELWVAAVLRHPLLPNFADAPDDPDPHWYWVRGNLFDDPLALSGGDRVQGVVGNSNVLGILCVLALIVFGLRMADAAPSPVIRALWTAAAAYLFLRAGSVTAIAAAAAAAAVLVAALVMRRAVTPGGRTRRYAILALVAAGGVAAVILAREQLLGALGRGGDLTGRAGIWQTVWERAREHPVAGNGFASPWLPWDAAFDGWIVDHGITVFHAHQMWLDVFLQLGAIGVALVAGVFAALVWRSWFFAVDRPRWDMRADRPYRAITLLPLMAVWMLLAQGLSESGPIMLWGWMTVTMLAFKIKTVPIMGAGPDEEPSAQPAGPGAP